MSDSDIAAAVPQVTASYAEKLLYSMFRLFQVVKIHQANNKMLLDGLEEFKEAFYGICEQSDPAEIHLHRGRFYLNEERISYSSVMMMIAENMAVHMQVRNICGFRLHGVGELNNASIIAFVNMFNQAQRADEEPALWLKIKLDEEGCSWIDVLTEEDIHVPSIDPDMTEVAEISQDKIIKTMARRAYSNALASMHNMAGKFSAQRRVGMQKSKRIIQLMIDVLTEDESILLGMSTIRKYDDYTYTHSVNVSILSMCLGRRLGLPRQSIEQLGLCGLFHDLGKIDVPIDLINKPGMLTSDEFEKIKKHPVNSVRQIMRMNAEHPLKIKLMLPPLEHHQGIKLDGYPKTRYQSSISFFGRILAVADHYDALTSNRCYRPSPISPDTALKMMVADAGVHLDPIILKAFIGMIGVYPMGSLLILNTNQVGLVVETPESSDSGRPIVRLLTWDETGKLRRGSLINLAEHGSDGEYKYNVVKCLHPSECGIQANDFIP